MAQHEQSMNTPITNVLTFVIGCVTMGVAALQKVFAVVFVISWLPQAAVISGITASLIAACKALHEWRRGIQQEKEKQAIEKRRLEMEEEEHRARMQLFTPEKRS